ncbi:hypothetical protein O6H91_09G105800 [Diphasiastrum complanatum]|uniref:Uncharacterized protein n=1 Tax=Diphasiastrum complanatum TaxID=34168 RepID=A0ACC2CSL7_DIPCM|nr:hypothetical protein O6H91_09G105800 [Diphasiastrum complanatum]
MSSMNEWSMITKILCLMTKLLEALREWLLSKVVDRSSVLVVALKTTRYAGNDCRTKPVFYI